MQQKQHYHHIDLMRFVFSMIIVYFHTLNSNIIPYTNDMPIYDSLAKNCNNAANIVAAFFIISGIFMYRSYTAKPDGKFFDYLIGRVVRLWPALAFALVAESLLRGKFDWEQLFLNLSFLQCSGLSLQYKGILWYVSSFFFASIFYYALFKNTAKNKVLFITAILTYFSFVFRINYTNGGIGGRETLFNILNLGIVRGIGDIGIGILVAEVYEQLHKIKSVYISPIFNKILIVLRGIGEVGSLVYLFSYFLFGLKPRNHMAVILVMCFLMLSMLSSGSLLGFLLNRKWMGFCGKYAYSIYVMQQTSFLILMKTAWTRGGLIARPWLALSSTVVFSVLVGIAVYYLVERPCTSLYLKWQKIYRARLAAK